MMQKHSENITTITLSVNGIDCTVCGETVCNDLEKTENIASARFDIVASEIQLNVSDKTLNFPLINSIISSHGGKLIQKHASATKEKPMNWQRVLFILSGVFCVAGITSDMFSFVEMHYTKVFYGIAVLTGILFTARKALSSLRAFSLDMHVLMCIAVIGAIGIGEWREAAMVVFLFSLSNLLESYSVDRARNAITKLMQLAPESALVKRDNELIQTKIDAVKANDILLIRPGERIPLDGEVLEGNSYVDQSPITGESIPVEKKRGEAVFAGSINGHGVIEIKVTHISSETTLARIIQLVKEAAGNKPPIQRFVDSFAKIYTPIVVVLAVMIATIPPSFLGYWSDWFYRALVMLIIACPCALVISTPVTIVSGLTRAARNGLLIKGGAFLELAGKIENIVFDKTGTLTKGEPVLQNINCFASIDHNRLLAMAGAIEQNSEHHLAKAIMQKIREGDVQPLNAKNVHAYPGKGIAGDIEGECVYIGNEKFLAEKHHSSGLNGSLKNESSSFFIWNDKEILGQFVIADPVKKESKASLKRLKELGVKRIIMLTGDQKHTAEKIAKDLGIDSFHAELLPQDKLAILRTILKTGLGKTAMIGDGINDAPSLAAAYIGISMGGSGTDVALETADVAIMNDNLLKIPELIDLSRRVLRIVRQNIAAAILIKLVFTALVIPGIATLWMAVLADVGTSLAVIINGMRALRQKS
jgi:Cd2+/Zn2+-exporting ATPase